MVRFRRSPANERNKGACSLAGLEAHKRLTSVDRRRVALFVWHAGLHPLLMLAACLHALGKERRGPPGVLIPQAGIVRLVGGVPAELARDRPVRGGLHESAPAGPASGHNRERRLSRPTTHSPASCKDYSGRARLQTCGCRCLLWSPRVGPLPFRNAAVSQAFAPVMQLRLESLGLRSDDDVPHPASRYLPVSVTVSNLFSKNTGVSESHRPGEGTRTWQRKRARSGRGSGVNSAAAAAVAAAVAP